MYISIYNIFSACVEEVLPSTDLPPLVQGDLRCFLVVDIGKIVWSSTATAQVPPASPAYIRLRWWGESSEGTVFKYVLNFAAVFLSPL